MPTENRSSTEMVSVPRDLAEEINSALYDHDLKGLTVRLQELLDKPELHQGDPVTLPACIAKLGMSHDWDQGYADGWKGCLEEAAKLGPLYTHPAPAVQQDEPYGWVQTRGNAINRFTQEWDIVQEWEDQSFQYKAMHDHPASADAGEVERLRFDLAEMTKSYEALGELYAGTQKGFERLQAERKALLHEWRNGKGMTLEQSISLIERIEAALSASTEPEERS